MASESQLCCKLTLGFGQCLPTNVSGLGFLIYQMEGTDTTASLGGVGRSETGKRLDTD